ncbi:MAG: thioredoxin domain-containing protein [bacterium]
MENEEQIVVIETTGKEVKKNPINQNQIAGAIIIAGILIAGAILLKGGGTTTTDPVKLEAKITKSTATFSACLDSGKYTEAVAASTSSGSTAGVNGTPKGFILKDNKVVATIDGAEPTKMTTDKIDKALNGNMPEIINKLTPVSTSDFVLGSPTAPVTIVLYVDFQCPFCGKFFKETEQNVLANYVKDGKVKLVSRDFAFLGEESQKSAEAARCANDQGKFWEYHDYLFTHQNGENKGNFSNLNLKTFAKEVGLK